MWSCCSSWVFGHKTPRCPRVIDDFVTRFLFGLGFVFWAGSQGVGLSSLGARGKPRGKPGGLKTTPHDRISYRGVFGRIGF